MTTKAQQEVDFSGLPTKVSQADFARLVAVSAPAVSQAIRAGRITPDADGLIDTRSQALAWFAKRDESKVRDMAPGRAPEILTAKQRADLDALEKIKLDIARLDLELKERELAKSKGELVSRDAVRIGLSDYAGILSSKLLNFPSRYGQEIASKAGCDPRKLIGALERAIRIQLEEFQGMGSIEA